MTTARQRASTKEQVTIEFPDNALLAGLAGSHHKNFVRLEQRLDVRIASRGNLVAVEGILKFGDRGLFERATMCE